MADQKPILTHSRVANAIAKSDGSPKQKRALLGEYGKAVRAARGDAAAAGQAESAASSAPDLAKRIRNARAKAADVRDQALSARTKRVHNARMKHQAEIRRNQFSPQKAALAPRSTPRSIGRDRTGLVGSDGRIKPMPSARIDSQKRFGSVGISAVQLRQPPFPRR